MSLDRFFDEQSEQSVVKSHIVAKYFGAWAKVMIPRAKAHDRRIGYIDLFAGPGRYRDGAKSTPILILEKALADPDMCEMLVTIFNDIDAGYAESLEKEIDAIPNIGTLKHKPQVANEEVGDALVGRLEQLHFVPSLFFIDPWGYKGLSLRLINSALKDWGCDCVIFFNYNRINMGLSNDAFEQHMNALFGRARAAALREQLLPLSPPERELTIIEAVAESLKEDGPRYVLPFRFKSASGKRTSHHLVFVSKHVRGYEIMKEIMARESSTSQQGVASFEYSPAPPEQPLLFELSRPLDDLAGILLRDFSGCTLTMQEVYDRHQVGRPYIKANYKGALTKLEQEGRIIADPPACERPSRNGAPTFAGWVTVTFPGKARK